MSGSGEDAKADVRHIAVRIVGGGIGGVGVVKAKVGRGWMGGVDVRIDGLGDGLGVESVDGASAGGGRGADVAGGREGLRRRRRWAVAMEGQVFWARISAPGKGRMGEVIRMDARGGGRGGGRGEGGRARKRAGGGRELGDEVVYGVEGGVVVLWGEDGGPGGTDGKDAVLATCETFAAWML